MSDPSIQQTARDHATQIGVVHGNVYLSSPASEAEVSLDLETYREHQLAQLAIWEQQYTRLDVDPAVALAGQDLRPIPDSRLALTEAFIRHDRLVVVGGAGAGKTTSMLYLVASALPGGSLADRLAEFVPIYLELGRFRSDSSAPPLDGLLLLMADTLYRGKACPEPPSLRGIRKLLASHRFLYLLDGLNEVQPEIRASCLTAISDLAKLHSDHRIVLSSRPHGFLSPQGWEVVLLRELDEAQIPEFVERYRQDEASQALLRTVLGAQNPLLRLPLFLSLVVRMCSSPLSVDQQRMRSRSGLIDQYVKTLLQRTPMAILSLDRLREALDRLAQAFQASGQILTLAEARDAIGSDASSRLDDVQQILDDLYARGILATDGRNLRFWHQTLQEYFYAGSVARRWRESKKQIGRMPRWLRRLASRPEEEEALSFLVAHLRDEEADAALRQGLPINPALAISWADDLSLEGRAPSAMETFKARARRFALDACKYTEFGSSRRSIFLIIAAQYLILSIPVTFFLTEFLGNIGISPFLAVWFSLGCMAGIGGLQFLDAWRCPPIEKLEAMLGATPDVRDRPLRNALSALAQEIRRPRAFRPAIRALAGVSVMEVVNGEELVTLLRTSEAPYATTRVIGHLDTPFALPLLIRLLALNNSLSQAALDALATRASRLPAERPKITNVLREAWNNDQLDHLIRRQARKILLRAGERPEGWVSLAGYFLFRFLAALVAALVITLAIAAPAITLTTGFTGCSLSLFTLLGICSFIWWDARRIGARGIPGHPKFENSTPVVWALSSLGLPFLQIPRYFLSRRRIRRDAEPIDWDSILQAIQKEQAHGDSLSITHSPSPRR